MFCGLLLARADSIVAPQSNEITVKKLTKLFNNGFVGAHDTFSQSGVKRATGFFGEENSVESVSYTVDKTLREYGSYCVVYVCSEKRCFNECFDVFESNSFVGIVPFKLRHKRSIHS